MGHKVEKVYEILRQVLGSMRHIKSFEILQVQVETQAQHLVHRQEEEDEEEEKVVVVVEEDEDEDEEDEVEG